MKLVGVLKHTQTLILATTLLLATACAPKKSNQHEDFVLQSYRLIDEQRTSEAIALLERELINDPGNYSYKIVLASAYAHKAGFKIQKLVPTIMQIDKLNKSTEKKENVQKETSQKSKDNGANNTTLQIAALFSKISGALEAYSSIPVINRDESTYLVHAIRILNDLAGELKPEDAVYKAILEVVLFKHILAEDLLGEFAPPSTKGEANCRVDLETVNGTVINLGKLLIDIYTDLGFSNPSQAQKMTSIANETAEAVSDITLGITTMSIIDEASNVLLKQSAIQNGFGKIVKCGNM